MGKRNSKPRTEVHIIHHYLDERQNSETESNQDLYNSRVVRHGSKTPSQSSLASTQMWNSRKPTISYRTYSEPSLLSDGQHMPRFSKLTPAAKGKYASQFSVPEVTKHQCAANQNSTEWDFNSIQEEDTDNVTLRNSVEEDSSSIDTISEDMYIRCQSVRELSRLHSDVKVNNSFCDNDSNNSYLFVSDSDDEESEYQNYCTNPLEKERLKPLEYIDYFEVDQYGCILCTNIWTNLMWREALRRSSEHNIAEDMANTTSVKMYGPPKIPKTPSRAINNMLESKCGKPFESKPKHMIASVICGVFTLITMMYDQIHKDKPKASHKMWMISCGSVATVSVIAAYLFYSIIVGSAFLLHALLYYGVLLAALTAVGLCVSGAVFFDKEATNEDFEKER